MRAKPSANNENDHPLTKRASDRAASRNAALTGGYCARLDDFQHSCISILCIIVVVHCAGAPRLAIRRGCRTVRGELIDLSVVALSHYCVQCAVEKETDGPHSISRFGCCFFRWRRARMGAHFRSPEWSTGRQYDVRRMIMLDELVGRIQDHYYCIFLYSMRN